MKQEVEKKGFFGAFGGTYVPEALAKVLREVEETFESYKDDADFHQEWMYYLTEYIGRENPLTFAENLTKQLNGAKIYLKREDLNHTGAHKINNAIGQILLAKRMGKTRIIAETGAGQHGVATATAAAMFDLPCRVYMGEVDAKRQELNVFRMELLGAEVISVDKGEGRLKDAVDRALEDLVEHKEDTFYLIGSAVGPHPYPSIVRHFQAIISAESKRQLLKQEGKLPKAVIACVGGGSNAIGAFAHYIEEADVALIGVEPAEAASLTKGKPAILHGFKSYTLVDENGEPSPTQSIAAGLDYPGIGPEHSFLKTSGRATYETVSGEEALAAFHELARTEGIIPALESAHAIAYAMKLAPKLDKKDAIVVNLSGRGDKDVQQIYEMKKRKH